MLIEVGKKYINAVGKIIQITKKDTIDEDYPFLDDNGEWYMENGLYQYGTKCNFDLICLVDDSLLKQYEANEITKKEFIAKHIELYTGEKL